MWKRSVCAQDCPDTCGLLVKVEEGLVPHRNPVGWWMPEPCLFSCWINKDRGKNVLFQKAP